MSTFGATKVTIGLTTLEEVFLKTGKEDHEDVDEKISSENIQAVANGKKADFTMIAYSTLPSIFSYSAEEDAKFIENNADSQKY